MRSSETSGPRVMDEKTETRFKAMDHIRELWTRWKVMRFERGTIKIPCEAMGCRRYKIFLG